MYQLAESRNVSPYDFIVPIFAFKYIPCDVISEGVTEYMRGWIWECVGMLLQLGGWEGPA
jgi:hypothetical protein